MSHKSKVLILRLKTRLKIMCHARPTCILLHCSTPVAPQCVAFPLTLHQYFNESSEKERWREGRKIFEHFQQLVSQISTRALRRVWCEMCNVHTVFLLYTLYSLYTYIAQQYTIHLHPDQQPLPRPGSCSTRLPFPFTKGIIVPAGCCTSFSLALGELKEIHPHKLYLYSNPFTNLIRFTFSSSILIICSSVGKVTLGNTLWIFFKKQAQIFHRIN